MATEKLQVVDTLLPHSQEEVIERLLAEFDELPGQLQLCARYIIDHPHEVGLQSMRTLAQAADVHPNSFVRLARQLGFDGYDAMRERFRDFVRGGIGSSPDRVHWLREMHRQGGSTASAMLPKTAVLPPWRSISRSQRTRSGDEPMPPRTKSRKRSRIGSYPSKPRWRARRTKLLGCTSAACASVRIDCSPTSCG